MTELTEREQQIVAWLRKEADKLANSAIFLVGSNISMLLTTATVHRNLADAIERGEPWGEQA